MKYQKLLTKITTRRQANVTCSSSSSNSSLAMHQSDENSDAHLSIKQVTRNLEKHTAIPHIFDSVIENSLTTELAIF
jgi:hypothetical protein